GGPFTIGAGDKKRLVVNINPQHRFFPTARVLDERVRLTFEGTDFEISIPITLQEVDTDVKYFRGVFAMDFGTTNTCYAWKNRFDANSDPQEAFAAARTSTEVPTLIYFKDVANPKKPKFKIGVDASHDIKEFAGKIYAYFISIKRLIGVDKDFVVLDDKAGSQGRQVWKVEEIASYFIDELVQRAEKELGGEKITHVTSTYPTLYTTGQKNKLKKAFEIALARRGVEITPETVTLKLDEANAAAFNFVYNYLLDEFRKMDITSSETHVLTFDFGGGTIDVSLIHAKIKRDGIRVVITTDLKGVTGEPRWAGDNVTLEVFKILKRKVALEVAKERTAAAKVQMAQQKKAKDVWEGGEEEEKEEEEVDWFAKPGADKKKKGDAGPTLEETLKALGVDLVNDEPENVYQEAADVVDRERPTIEMALAKNISLAQAYEEKANAEGRAHDPRMAERVEEAMETLVPTKFTTHADVHPHREAAAKELFYELWHEAETMKVLAVGNRDGKANVSQVLRRVATYAKVDPKVFNDRIAFSRDELNRAIRPALERALRKTHALYENAKKDRGTAGIQIGAGKAEDKIPLKLL
ncbi:MAG TPA: Hsp70 family protein, partial [Planctomycetota bacterium]|nr:Hsp70 family protein [Planctomycetota bacterium]